MKNYQEVTLYRNENDKDIPDFIIMKSIHNKVCTLVLSQSFAKSKRLIQLISNILEERGFKNFKLLNGPEIKFDNGSRIITHPLTERLRGVCCDELVLLDKEYIPQELINELIAPILSVSLR